LSDEAGSIPRADCGKRWIAWRCFSAVRNRLHLAVEQRRQIASGYIDRELERRGVQGRYEIVNLAWASSASSMSCIGDPAHRISPPTGSSFACPTVCGRRGSLR
jgi:hypothetical protein